MSVPKKPLTNRDSSGKVPISPAQNRAAKERLLTSPAIARAGPGQSRAGLLDDILAKRLQERLKEHREKSATTAARPGPLGRIVGFLKALVGST